MVAVKIPKKQWFPLLVGCLTFIVFLINSKIIIYNIEKRQEEEYKAQILSKTGELRAKLESVLNTRLYIGYGLVSFIAINKGITQSKFEEYAELLIKEPDPVIRNISILKNTTITYVYPYSSNKEAIGRDLLTIPDQRESVLRAIQTRKPVITGPVNLVQGGRGIISRIPVFIDDTYWGQISVVLMQDALFDAAGLNTKNSNFEIAIRDASSGIVIYGNSDLFTQNVIRTEIALPIGEWELYARSMKSLQVMNRYLVFHWFLWGSISILFGFFALIIARTQLLLREKATHDYLTGLPNRAYLIDHMDSTINLAERHKEHFVVAMLDVNGFKQINDNLGHSAGDEVLKELGTRLVPHFRKSDIVARFGGDEFVLVLNNVGASFNNEELIYKINNLVSEPFVYRAKEIYISVSVGIALYPEDAVTVEKLLSIADTRMYLEKQKQ